MAARHLTAVKASVGGLWCGIIAFAAGEFNPPEQSHKIPKMCLEEANTKNKQFYPTFLSTAALQVTQSFMFPPTLGEDAFLLLLHSTFIKAIKIKQKKHRKPDDAVLTFCTHPAKDPLSLRLIGSVWMLCTPPRYKLCGRERCQNPFGETVITSGSWSICNAETKYTFILPPFGGCGILEMWFGMEHDRKGGKI